jgi:hypothetical protein
LQARGRRRESGKAGAGGRRRRGLMGAWTDGGMEAASTVKIA